MTTGEEQGEPSTPHAKSEKKPALQPSTWLWLTAAIAAGLFLGLGSLYLFGRLADVFALLVLGITIASALGPVADSLSRKLPRLVAVMLIYTVLVAVLVAVGMIITPILVEQAKDLGSRLPALIEQVRGWLTMPANIPVPSLAEILFNSLGAIGSAIVTLPIAMLNSLLDVSLVLFISLYWLLLSPQMISYVLSLYPPQRHARVRFVLQHIGQSMGGYLRASVINGVIMGILTYIGLVIIGVPFPAVLSLLMGVLEIIPALGPVIAGFFIVAIALLQSPQMALISLIFVIVLQQAEGNILVPNIMRRATEISPLLVILALLAGSSIGGLMGALVSIPIVAALKVMVDQIAAPVVRQWMGAQEEH
jgi:predicted PurR-regulated permease PerM